MLTKMARAQQALRLLTTRTFSTEAAAIAAVNPKVWMSLTRDGTSAGKVTIELYEDSSPDMAYNFAAFFNGLAD